MLSRWHVHANDYARSIAANPSAEITAVWDEQPDRGSKWAEELRVTFEPDFASLLSRSDVDAVCVVTPTNIHPDVMIQAANARKHIFTEKVLTTTVADAQKVQEAIEASGVQFCISFPRRANPHLLYAKHALDTGLLGRLTSIRIRIAHAGASRDWLPNHFYSKTECGGGAMMDLGAHGMYLARWFGGTPKRVSSTFTELTGKEVEDNAVSVIEFVNDVIGINETSFVAYPDSYSVELDGTEGGYRMLSPRDGSEIRSDHLSQKGWHKPESLPAALPSPIDQWIAACTDGGKIHFGISEAMQLTELMEAAYTSATEHRSVEI